MINPHSSISSIILWIIAVELFGCIGACFTSKLNYLKDSGFGVARTFGIFFFGFLLWSTGYLLKFELSVSFTRSLFLVLALVSLFYCIKKDILKELISSFKVWIIFFSILLLSRSLSPEIFFGEKPMDFTFLNYFSRILTLPPEDPWAAGSPLYYYYFGAFIWGSLAKITGIPTAIAYNLSLATVGGLLASSLFSAFYTITKERKIGLLLTTMTTLGGTLGYIKLFYNNNLKTNFNLAWASTRSFKDPGFTEYPVWSIVFGDLHAHVTSFCVWGIFFCLLIGFDKVKFRTVEYFTHRVLCSLVLVFFLITNSWDIFVAGTLFTLVWSFNSISKIVSEKRNSLPEILVDILILGVFSLIIATPYIFSALINARSQALFAAENTEYSYASRYLWFFGFWIVTTISLSIPSIKLPTIKQFNYYLISILFYLFLFSFFCKNKNHLCSTVFIGSLFYILGILSLSRKNAVLASCLIVISFVISGTEIFVLGDRMNTIFKFLLSLSFIFPLATAFIYSDATEKLSKQKMFLVSSLLTVITFSSLLSGALASYGLIFSGRINTPRLTLDGSAYLDISGSEDADLIHWLNENIASTPVILEASGEPYREYARITMHTGLPTVLGWEYHVFQRGLSWEKINERRRAVDLIYRDGTEQEVHNLIKKYKIEYIIVSEIEKKRYGLGVVNRFANSSLYISRAGNSKGTIYQVNKGAL